MRLLLSRASWLALLFSAAVVEYLRGDPGEDADTRRIAALVLQLNDDDFARRESAARSLETLGEKTLPALRHTMIHTEELDLRRRARELVHAILMACGKSKSLGLTMAVIDEGEFMMGSPNAETSRRPDELQHRVRITRPFLLGVYEVTQDEYRKVMKTSPSWFASTGGGKAKIADLDTTRFPVDSVTWFDAIDFCNRLSKLDDYPPYYTLTDEKREGDVLKSATVAIAGGPGYRLPTEAEWEFACRAGSSKAFHFGDRSYGQDGNFKAYTSGGGYGSAPTLVHLGRTSKVGSYKPNPLGLYDMHGNAGEWCWDWYDKDYYATSPAADPQGPERGNHRVLRGGSWLVSDGSSRSASRFWLPPDERKEIAGFRVSRAP